ncbi:MarR family winged helix-turn-helix transcriptional regulator [Lactobacillaceae bacterium Melli_B3]
MTNINEEVANRIKVAATDIQNLAQQNLNKFAGLTQQQAVVMRIINNHPGMIQRELADQLNRKTASVSSILKTLEKKELVIRKQAPDNDRNKQLYLTEQGKKEVAKLVDDFNEVWHYVDHGLNPKEQETLLSLLDKLIENNR